MVTLILSHPSAKSFNSAIFNAAIAGLKDRGESYQIINLHRDGFNPLYGGYFDCQGDFEDPLIPQYQQMIKESDQLIFIFPIWESAMPGMLKGFFDRVFRPGFAFGYDENGMKPLLNSIRRCLVYTTSEAEWNSFRKVVENYFFKMILQTVGITSVSWLNCSRVSRISNEERVQFLEKVRLQNFENNN